MDESSASRKCDRINEKEDTTRQRRFRKIRYLVFLLVMAGPRLLIILFKYRSTEIHNFKITQILYEIRYHGSSSSVKFHVYHHVGGEDTHPWSATKVGDPIQATIPVTKRNNQQTTHTRHYPSRPAEIFFRLQ